ncbi:MAG: hypothetical protein QM728_03180 [Gordonia sp. (in: high G+C Gram-positive bacteria)]|uniref:hypothetical protein n=1 Tax=Gordonia sp. (in: high G+C Gram-positive bacteria) TaxID=84139 RepID=UPI0039E51C3E
MTEDPAKADPAADDASAEPDWKRRARLDAVFGGDEPDPEAPRTGGHGADWYRSNRPPHHS